ncbi:MAG: hypothetical protein U1E49_15825 [Hyphomicrobiaceae bacterium]
MGSAAGGEAGVEVDEGRVPVECGGEGCGVEERRRRARPPAMWRWPLCLPLSSSKGRGQRCCLLARDLAELRHADDESDGGPLADAGDRADEVEAARQVGARFELGGKLLLLGFEEIAEGNDVLADIGFDSGVSGVLETALEADDILLDLLDVGEVGSELCEAFIGGFAGFQPGGALGDEAGVEAIVLGPLEGVAGEGSACMGWRWRTVRPWSLRWARTPCS